MLDAAVELNYPPALARKAQYYLHDWKSGSAIDLETGIGLLERASELGNSHASLDLSYRYQDARGTTQDLIKAFHFASKALDQGSEFAAGRLARVYLDGIGTEADRAKAYTFLYIDCYSPSSERCLEARRISAALNKEEKKQAEERVAYIVQAHPGIAKIIPPVADARLMKVSRAELIDTYTKVSPLYSLHRDVVSLHYTEHTRPIVVYMSIMDMRWKPKGWGPDHPEWARTRRHFMQNVENLDANTRPAFQNIVKSSASSIDLITRDLSDDDLRDLIALYQLPLGHELARMVRLIPEVHVENSNKFWLSAASGRPLEEMQPKHPSSQARFKGLSHRAQQSLATCDTALAVFTAQAGLYISPGEPSIFSWVLNHGLPSENPKWRKICLKADSFVNGLMYWPPIRREVDAIEKWRTRWIQSAQMKELSDSYFKSVGKLRTQEEERLKSSAR